jgi:predicted phosphate transport protein (TIGR00153 family)
MAGGMCSRTGRTDKEQTLFNLIPREDSFFDLLEASSKNMLACARLLRDLVEDYRDVPGRLAKLTDAEHVGDHYTHQILEKLNKTFVTPMDREDIHALTIELDNIVDLIELIADRMLLYQIEKPTDFMISMVRLLERCCEQIDQAMPLLRHNKRMKEILSHTVEVNRLENEADKLNRTALSTLFDNPQDPLYVIKWKEVYDTLESAIDMTEDVADQLHGIVIKNA